MNRISDTMYIRLHLWQLEKEVITKELKAAEEQGYQAVDFNFSNGETSVAFVVLITKNYKQNNSYSKKVKHGNYTPILKNTTVNIR